MKKKNILLFVLLGLITLCINNKVLADDSVVGFLECKYKLDNSSAINQGYVDDSGVVSFYYSELLFKTDVLKERVFMKHDSGFYKAASDFQTNKSNNGFSQIYFTENIKNLDETFRNFIGEDGTCPKYVMLKSSGNNNYTPYFNNDEKTICGDDHSSCPVIGTSVPGGEKHMVYSNEMEWFFYLSGKGACDDAYVKIYVDNNKLKGDISYPTTSSFYEKSQNQNLKNIEVYLNSDGFGTGDLNFIYNLLKNNKITNGFIRSDKKAKINFNESGVHSATCSFESRTIARKYNCTTYLAFRTNELIQIESSYKNMVEEYNDFIENKLCGDSGNCDYSNYTKEQVNDLRSEIEKALENGNNLVDLYGKISDYYTENQDAACTETKEMITKDLENIQNMNMTSVGTGDDPQSGINKLNMALNALSERAKTLEDEALQEQIAQLQTKNDKLAERNEHYYKVLQQKFFADVSLSFKDGCDMITPKLKDWLIRGLDIMKIVALILTLILGMVDFFKGVASGNADTMKKVWTSFSRRLIAVALLFLLPVILEFILGLVSIGGLDSANPLCGLK